MRWTLLRSWIGLLACAALVVVGGCQDETDRVHGTGVYNRPVGSTPESCAVPGTGCPCEDVGSYVECGDVTLRAGDYVTCSMGKRRCLIEAVWGECVGEQTTVVYDPEDSRDTLAVSGPSECEDDVCDPYCYVTHHDGFDVSDLPDGTCQSTAGGIELCKNTCGFTGPHGSMSYDELPSDWRRLPGTCDGDADACGYNSNCGSSGGCVEWSYPCFDPEPPDCTLARKVDLQLGPPCKSSTGNTYHFQVCNRGPDTANAGTVKIGIYTDRSKITDDPFTMAYPGAPDAGVVTFNLGPDPGRYIESGKCIDVTTGNSTSTPSPLAGLTDVRAIAINYDTSFAECNLRNNWQVYSSESKCTDCTNLQCNQTCPSTTLFGRIMDPRGDTGNPDTSGNPVTGVVVYVPNEAVAALTDGVACDTCAGLFSGTPITSTVSGADGTFTLVNVPDSTPFPLVLQTGRWRRQVMVDPIPACEGAELPRDKARLPRNKAEGDIPRIAATMAAGDHLQCLLRKIGIDDAEFTTRFGNGRIHLYDYNGMNVPGANCTDNNGTCATDFWKSLEDLKKYSAVIAPCDKNPFEGDPVAPNPYYGTSSAPFGYAKGPYPNEYGYTSYDAAVTALSPLNTDKPPFPTHPDPAHSATQPRLKPLTIDHARTLKEYIDMGGRLFATHWMGYFLTAPTYPAAVNYEFGQFVDYDRGPADFPFTINTAHPLGVTLAEWLDSSTVTFKRWRHLSRSVNAPAIALVSGDSRAAPVNHPNCTNSSGTVTPAACRRQPTSADPIGGWGGPQVAALQFDAPWGAAPEHQCGRVVIAQSHVAEAKSGMNQGVFPASCADGTRMSGEERAFEFLLFSATQCIGTVTPPPPPTAPLSPVTVSFDYDSDCPLGTQPEWTLFQWQAVVPDGTMIQFRARSADAQGELAAASDVAIGTANASTTTWTSDGQTVHYRLQHATPPLPSRKWLRVSARLNPVGTTTPILREWRQKFDCKPAE